MSARSKWLLWLFLAVVLLLLWELSQAAAGRAVMPLTGERIVLAVGVLLLLGLAASWVYDQYE